MTNNNWLPIEELLHQMEAYAVDDASGKGASIIVPSNLWDEAIQRIKSHHIAEPSKMVGDDHSEDKLDMVERVAIWLWTHYGTDIQEEWSDIIKAHRKAWQEDARHIIAAIHGDENKLREAAKSAYEAITANCYGPNSEKNWRAGLRGAARKLRKALASQQG